MTTVTPMSELMQRGLSLALAGMVREALSHQRSEIPDVQTAHALFQKALNKEPEDVWEPLLSLTGNDRLLLESILEPRLEAASRGCDSPAIDYLESKVECGAVALRFDMWWGFESVEDVASGFGHAEANAPSREAAEMVRRVLPGASVSLKALEDAYAMSDTQVYVWSVRAKIKIDSSLSAKLSEAAWQYLQDNQQLFVDCK